MLLIILKIIMIETPSIWFQGLNPLEHAVTIFSNSLCIFQGRNKTEAEINKYLVGI